MSGTYKRWIAGDKVTEKHLAGPFDGMADTIVSGSEISDAGGLTIDISAGYAHIVGYEQRPAAVTSKVVTASQILHIYLKWDETYSYSYYSIGSESFPPSAVPMTPGYILVGIIQTGAASIDWIWNNPFVRGGHIDEFASRVGLGVPDKGMLFGTPHVRRVTYANVPAITEVDVLSWPSAGTARGRLSFISWWTEGAAVTNRLRVIFDAETAGATTWFFEEPTNDPFTAGSFPHIDADLIRSNYYDHVGQMTRKSFDADGGGALPHFHFWTRGQFETGFTIRAYNGDGGVPRDMNIIAFWEEIPNDTIGGY